MDEAERSGLVAFLHRGRLLFADRPEAVRRLFGRAVFEIVPDDVRHAAAILSRAGNGFEVETFGDRLNVAARGGLLDRAGLSRLLAAEGIKVSGLRRVKPSLENVFISLIKKEENKGI
jgi:ABC-2 type transport system ATP-binding protein